MKMILFLLSTIVLVGCNCAKEKTNQKNAPEMISEMNSEKMNDTVAYEESVMLLGKANKTGLLQDPFRIWFADGYKNYVPDPETMEKLKPLLKNVDIKVFMGTWCSDSQREIPHFYKILEASGFDENKLTLIAVTEEKDTPQNYEAGLNIEYVPTIIFSREGKEMGRIVESTVETLEKDMLAILSGAGYKHTYED